MNGFEALRAVFGFRCPAVALRVPGKSIRFEKGKCGCVCRLGACVRSGAARGFAGNEAERVGYRRGNGGVPEKRPSFNSPLKSLRPRSYLVYFNAVQMCMRRGDLCLTFGA